MQGFRQGTGVQREAQLGILAGSQGRLKNFPAIDNKAGLEGLGEVCEGLRFGAIDTDPKLPSQWVKGESALADNNGGFLVGKPPPPRFKGFEL